MTRKLIDDCFRTDPRDAKRMTHERTLEVSRDGQTYQRLLTAPGTRANTVW